MTVGSPEILVFGTTGQVATALSRHAGVTCVGREAADLSDPTQVSDLLRDMKIGAIINAAAYTAVDKAETERDIAMAVNGTSVGAMAAQAAAQRVPFVHISTDYVFDGSGDRPWHPDDAPDPLGVYGHSKLAGEALIRKAGGVHAILRTSWVFSAHGNNFLKTMLRLSETRDHLTIVADQIGGPTPATAIAAACMKIAKTLLSEPEKSGTYHFAGTPDTSWAGFARKIFKAAGRDVTVEDIPTSAYPTPALRPPNSRLDCSSLSSAFGIARPDWQAAMHEIVKAL